MVDLIAKSPCHDLLPITIGALTLEEVDAGVLTSLAPFKGQKTALGKALKDAHGMALPANNRSAGRAGARTLWFGQNTWLLAGPAPAATLRDHAALTDQSDAWAVVSISGEGVEDTLARLVPLDLRPGAFKRGHTARTQLQHLSVAILRTGQASFQILAFRSMARTLVHDLKTAMESVAARG